MRLPVVPTLAGRAVAVAAATMLAVALSPSAAHAALTCSERSVPVRIAEGGPASHTVVGELCWTGASAPSVVQLLAAGATYTRYYWNADGGTRSYVGDATSAGYATFNIDRIGTGESSKPPSTQLDVTAGAVAMRDVITGLRAGTVGGRAFQKVVLVTQSLGTAIAWLMGNAADAIVASSELHRINHQAWNALPVYTATSDPRFAGSGLDAGYLTTVPGGRQMFHAGTSDVLVAEDEANKDLSTTTELAQAYTLVDQQAPSAAPSRLLTKPVLVIIGDKDPFFCGGDSITCNSTTVGNQEAPYYSGASHVDVRVLANMGHSLALHSNSSLFHLPVISWLVSVVPPS